MKLTVDYPGTADELMASLDGMSRGVWNDRKLRDWADGGGIVADDLPIRKVNPASVDLSISRFIRRPRWWWRNPITRLLVWKLMPKARRNMKNKSNESFYWGNHEDCDEFVLWPGDFVLLSTVEKVKIPDDACALLRTKSTSGRMGFECMDAGWGDSGWGLRVGGCHWTIEVFNPSPWPILIIPNEFYVQMIMMDLCESAEKPYDGRYSIQGIIPIGPREEIG